jgi:hypothetical protein
MTGKELLDEIRFIIEDANYPRYNEINRAFRSICRHTSFSWLRREEECLMTFEANKKEYTLDMSEMRQLQAIHIYGTSSNKIGWTLLEESPPQLFEQLALDNRDSRGQDRTGVPKCYKIVGGPLAKITVTPTPSEDFNVRVSYIAHLPVIDKDSTVQLPESYHDTLATLASSYILERSEDPTKIQYAFGLQQRVLAELDDLVRDTVGHRTKDIERPRTKWLR